ncbi:Uncharacterized protein TCM_028330 [Theobroma cacao]|uniref:Uncharacterized protein n=1 Tax=Theobroma cacao TaxID=3641 RepID=A0A061GAT4_THECC|nr:Uncharacterized protein TCM_028330 [Theobroma cacao]
MDSSTTMVDWGASTVAPRESGQRRPSRHQIRHRLGENRLDPRRKEELAGGEGTRPLTPPDLSPEGRADPGQLRRHRLGKPAVRVHRREISCRLTAKGSSPA